MQVNLSTFVTVPGLEWTRVPSMYNDRAFSAADSQARA